MGYDAKGFDGVRGASEVINNRTGIYCVSREQFCLLRFVTPAADQNHAYELWLSYRTALSP